MVLRCYEDFTAPQAARVLGCSSGTARSLEQQALAHLRSAAPELFAAEADAPDTHDAADIGEEARP
jgi:DNA-directed RNA polymerase specialized sigma24 family protein